MAVGGRWTALCALHAPEAGDRMRRERRLPTLIAL